MPSINATSDFQFTCIDFRVTQTGYLFKVATPGPSTTDYRLVYIPFARYPSLLMLEYLLLGEKELSPALQEVIVEAIKQDLSGDPAFVIVGDRASSEGQFPGPDMAGDALHLRESMLMQTDAFGDRPLSTGQPVADEFSFAIRPDARALLTEEMSILGARAERGGELWEEGTVADRPINQPTRVIREVYLSKTAARNLHKMQPENLAYRVQDQQLWIDWVDSQATRDDKQDAVTFAQVEQAIRVYKQDTTLEMDFEQALRNGSHELDVERLHLVGEREYQGHSLQVWQEQLLAVRDLRNPLWVNRAFELGVKKLQRVTRLNQSRLQADRALSRRTWVDQSRPLAVRERQKPTLLIKQAQWGTLKVHQYPALLHVLARGVRDVQKALRVERDTGWARKEVARPTVVESSRVLASRLISQIGHVERAQKEAFRQNSFGLYVRDAYGAAVRDSSESLTVMREYAAGRRVDKVEALIDAEFTRGTRPQEKALYLPREIAGGQRHDQQQLLLTRSDVATRTSTASLFVPRAEALGVRNAQRDLYVEKVLGAQRENRVDGDLFEDENGHVHKSGPQVPRPAELLEDTSALVDHLRGASYEGDLLFGQLEAAHFGLLLDSVLHAEHPDERVAYVLDVIFGYWDKLGDIMDDLFVGERLFDGPGWIDPDLLLSMLLPQRAGVQLPDFLFGARQRLNALLESGLVFQKAEHSGILTFDDLQAQRNVEHVGDLPNHELYSEKNTKPATMDDELLGQKALRPSTIDEELLGQTSERPSTIDEELLGQKAQRPSTIDEELLGQKAERSSTIDEELLGQKAERPSTIDEELLGQKTERPSTIDEELLGQKAQHASTLEDELLADHMQRPSLLDDESEVLGTPTARAATTSDEELLGEEMFRPATLQIENPYGYLDLRDATLSAEVTGTQEAKPAQLDSDLLADLQKRLAICTTGFLFGDNVERTGFLYDLYFLGERAIREGTLPDETWDKFAKLTLRQAIVGEGMFASEPARASELLESILSYRNGASVTLDDILVGDHLQDRYADDLTDILEGDRKLAEAILTDYVQAQRGLQDGTLEAPILSSLELKTAFLEKIDQLGRGLLYAPPNDTLNQNPDPEFHSGGLGVPESYDPKDPFNDYYPWTDDIDTLVLSREADWVQFHTNNAQPGVWERHQEIGHWICKSETDTVTGWYHNDFTHEDYQFTIDFRVDDTDTDGAGLVFRYLDAQNYYMFMVNGGDLDGSLGMNRPMQLYRVHQGEAIALGAPTNPFHWEMGRWYTLEVTLLGNRITLKVDGILQYDFTD